MRFAPLGESGQRALAKGRAAVVGCGALGTVAANGLARAGVGQLRIIDRDLVDLSNLQRQMLFDEEDAAKSVPKAIAAASHLSRINSAIQIEPVVSDLTAANIDKCLTDVDVIVDGTDNFETRYLINDFSVRQELPWIYGGAVGSVGQVMSIVPGKTPCLACVQSTLPPAGTVETCESSGILGSASTLVGAIQVAETLKILSGQWDSLPPGLFVMDLWTGRSTRLALEGLRERSDCSVCQHRQFRWLDGRLSSQTMTLCGRNAVQVAPAQPQDIDLNALRSRLSNSFDVMTSPHLLRFRAEGLDLSVFRDGRTIVKGTDDVSVARSVVARYLGS